MLTTHHPRGITTVLLCTLLLLQSCQYRLNVAEDDVGTSNEADAQQEDTRHARAIVPPASLSTDGPPSQTATSHAASTSQEPALPTIPVTTPTSPGTTPLYDVFISHAGEDKKTIAEPLYEELSRRGIRTFFDKEELKVGRKASEAMTHAMKTARCGVFILSPEFTAKEWPMKELRCFLDRYKEAANKDTTPPLLVPIFHRVTWDDCRMEPGEFRSKYASHFTGAKNSSTEREEVEDNSMQQVMETLQYLRHLKDLKKVKYFTGIECKRSDYIF